MPSNWVPKSIENKPPEPESVGEKKEVKPVGKGPFSKFRNSSKEVKLITLLGISILALGIWYGARTLKYWNQYTRGELSSEEQIDEGDKSLRTFESPINGVLYSEERFEALLNKKPLAVMINNHVEARPQSGLSRADVIYEIVAEGGITRLLGIFHSKDVNNLGSIRSVRTYYAQIAAEYDPYLVHAGGSSSEIPEADGYGFVRANGIPQVDHVTGWGSAAFTRVQGKIAPHNLYVSTIKAREEAEKLYQGWPTVPTLPRGWDFKDEEDTNSAIGVDTDAAHISFWEAQGSQGYGVEWRYDAESNTYLRYQEGVAHMDETADEQLRAKNIVVQYAEETPANDGKNHLIYDLMGSGDAKFYIDGKEYVGTWVKTELRERTKFYLGNGDDVKFNRGLIWIEVVPSRNYKITTEENL